MGNRRSRLGLVLFLTVAISSLAKAELLTFRSVDLPGALFTTVAGINDAADLVGSSDLGAFSNINGTFTPVTVPGGVNTTASDINNMGQIAGFAAFPNPSGSGFQGRGFVETNGVFTLLDTGDLQDPNVEGLNDAAQVVGVYSASQFGSGGFLYSDGLIITLDYPGSLSTFASAINNSGQIVGSAAIGGGLAVGFLYDHGVFTPIEFPGALSTFPTGINDSGQIVGTYSLGTGPSFGFLYDHGVFTPINDPEAAPRYQTTPTGINNLGQVAGYFTDDSNITHGFIATPVPEAGSRLPLAGGFIAFLYGRWCRNRIVRRGSRRQFAVLKSCRFL